VNVAGSPLAALAHVAIEVPVGEEVVRGSTRLTAGTGGRAQRADHHRDDPRRRVHADLMVDVVAANAKLRDRSAVTVAEIAGCSVQPG
jgi:N-acetylmuramic acid 6-phosphate etherase